MKIVVDMGRMHVLGVLQWAYAAVSHFVAGKVARVNDSRRVAGTKMGELGLQYGVHEIEYDLVYANGSEAVPLARVLFIASSSTTDSISAMP